MARKTGMFAALRKMFWAKVLSVVTAFVASLTAYYWNEITGKTAGPVARAPVPHQPWPQKQPFPPPGPTNPPSQSFPPPPNFPTPQVVPGSGLPTGPSPGPFSGPPVVGKLTNLQRATTCDILNCDVRVQGDHVVVTVVRPGSVGALLGLVPGDVIEMVDQQAIDSPAKLETSLAHSRYLFSTTIRVRRGNATLTGEVHQRTDNRLAVRRPLGA